METRQIEQVRIYKLYLRDIRGRIASDIVAISYKKESLINWYKDLLADEPYTEEKDPNDKTQLMDVSNMKVMNNDTQADEKVYLTKVFKKGSRLEWYEMPKDALIFTQDGVGINDSWTTKDHIEGYIKQQNGKVLMID